MPDEIESVHMILVEVELAMRERLRNIGVDLPHLLIAAGPSGNTLVLGKMNADLLKSVCSDLSERADRDLRQRCASGVMPGDRTTVLNTPSYAAAGAAVRKT